MEQRVAIITGASRGLGAALARFLGAKDYHVIVNARGDAALQSVAQEVSDAGGLIETFPGDILESNNRQDLVDAAARAGRLDLLVNNASSLGAAPLPPLESHPLGALERLFRINTIAPLGLIQLALPLLKSTGGLVVNISSDAARGGYPGWGAYGSTKAALDLITLTLAAELQDTRAGAVSVDPGDMRTRMHQQAYPGEDISDRPSPETTIPFWAWLLSQAPASITGQRFEAQASGWTVPA